MTPSPVSVTVQQPASALVTLRTPRVQAVVVGGFGPTGPPGPPGAGSIEYTQAVPAATWTVVHNLNRRPGGVSVYDTAGNQIETGVIVIDLNTIEITMVVPTAGKAVVE